MASSNLEYRVEVRGPSQVLTLVGEVDIAGVPGLKSFVEEQIQGGVVDLVYDLSLVDAIDSTGLGFLVWSRKRLREQSGRLRLVTSRPQVQRVLKLTGLGRLFESYLTLEEAIDAPPSDETGQADCYPPEKG